MKFPLILSFAFGNVALVVAQSLGFETPVILGNVNAPALVEASGIAASRTNPNVFWTHNDGPRDRLFAFRMDGALIADFGIGQATLDVEDIAIGPGPQAGRDYIYLGDVGSNSAIRDTVLIFRVAEPFVNLAWVDDPVIADLGGVEAFSLKYPDGTYDCEAIFVDPIDNVLFVATKQTGMCRIYSVPVAQLVANQVVDLKFEVQISFDRVNAGDISPDGKTIALRRGSRANAWLRSDGQTIPQALAGSGGTRIPVVGDPEEPNGEAVAFLANNAGYITLSEGDLQPVYYFRRTEACDQAPQFTTLPGLNGSGVLLSFSTCPGVTVAIERSPNLQDWEQVTAIEVTTGFGSFSDFQSAAPAFYRLRVVP